MHQRCTSLNGSTLSLSVDGAEGTGVATLTEGTEGRSKTNLTRFILYFYSVPLQARRSGADMGLCFSISSIGFRGSISYISLYPSGRLASSPICLILVLLNLI